MRGCAVCGEVNPGRARFCLGCGTALGGEPGAEVRRTVSVLFADVVGSTSLGERLDAEAVRRVMGCYFAAARGAVERHGGSLEKFIGDAVLAVFGVPRAREDDALRAVRAASDVRRDVALLNEQLAPELGEELQVRIGVNTGEVVVGAPRAGGSFATGDAVNVAARLEQAAAPGEVLLGASTYRLVRQVVDASPAGPLQAKGKSDPLAVWRLHAVLAGRPLETSRSLFVGRAAQLGALEHELDVVRRRRRCQVVALLGDAGEGKTRLSEEFLTRVNDSTTVLRGRCLSYGEGATFWPLREVVLDAAALRGDETSEEARAALAKTIGDCGDAQAVALRLSHLAGFEGRAQAPADLAWAVRVFLERLAVERPVVLVIDDLQWAEPGLLDTLENVATRSHSAPIMVLVLGRPELVEGDRAAGRWYAGKRITLEPLNEEAMGRMVQDLQLPDPVHEQLVRTAGGNPLFAEQLVAKLLDDGHLAEQDGQLVWVAASAKTGLTMPPTIAALLAARLDMLGPRERTTLECAAVVGDVFHEAALRALAGSRAGDVAEALATLTRKGLVRPADSDLPGLGPAHAFVHGLVRDATYEGMAKAVRAEIHEQAATWLAEAAAGTVPDEIVGGHLEQAWRYRRELRLGSARTRELGDRAASRLQAAAQRLELGDASGAADLLARSAALLAEDSPRRLAVILDLARQLFELGRFTEALEAVAEVERSTSAALAARARLLRSEIRMGTDPTYRRDLTEEVIAEVMPVLESTGDHRGLSDAFFAQAEVEVMRLCFTECLTALGRAVEHAVLAHDESRAGRARGYSFLALWAGPVPAEDAIRALNDLSEAFPTDLRLRAQMERGTCRLHAMCGRFDEARRVAELARRDLEAVGQKVTLANLAQNSGRVEELAGDVAAADREYVRARTALRELGDTDYLSTVAGLHACLLARVGRVEEAVDAVDEATTTGAATDVITQALVAEARGLLLARAGDLAALPAADRAVSLTATGEDPDDHAEAHAVAATVCAWLGLSEPCLDHLRLARASFLEKGNAVRATAMLHALDAMGERAAAFPDYAF